MINYKINVKSYICNGIEEEIENLEDNGNIAFSDSKNRSGFIEDLLSELIEQFENNMEYYGMFINPNFVDSVQDKIKWDHDFYGITVIE